jgi:hypothetical protein
VEVSGVPHHPNHDAGSGRPVTMEPFDMRRYSNPHRAGR